MEETNAYFELYQSLLKPYIDNASEITDRLQELYMKPESIPIFFNFFVSEEFNAKNFGAIGIRETVERCQEYLDDNFILNLLNQCLDLLLGDISNETFAVYLIPISKIFEMAVPTWDKIDSFIQTIRSIDMFKTITFLKEIVPSLNITGIENCIGKLVELLEYGFTVGPETLGESPIMLFILTQMCVSCHNQLNQQLCENFVPFLSQYAIQSLDLHDYLKIKSILYSYYHISFSLNEIILPMCQVLREKRFPIEVNLYIYMVLSVQLELTDLFLDNDTILFLIKDSIEFSIESYNYDVEQGPISIWARDIIIRCFERLSIEDASIISQNYVNELKANISNAPELYTMFIIIDCANEKQTGMITDGLLEILFFGLRYPDENIQKYTELVFINGHQCKEIREYYDTHMDELIFNLIVLVQIGNSIAYTILFRLVSMTTLCLDNYFVQLLDLFNNTCETFSQNAWAMLTFLLVHCSRNIEPYLNDIFQLCKQMSLQADSEDGQCAAIQCIGSLLYNNEDYLLSVLQEVKEIAISGYRSANIITKKASLSLLRKLIKKYPQQMVDLKESLLPTLLIICSSELIKDLKLNQPEYNAMKEFINNLIIPSILLLSDLITYENEWFLDIENIAQLFVICQNHFYISFLKKHVNAVLVLFQSICNFVKGDRKNFIDPIHKLLKYIISYNGIEEISNFPEAINSCICNLGIKVFIGIENTIIDLLFESFKIEVNRFTGEVTFDQEVCNNCSEAISNIILMYDPEKLPDLICPKLDKIYSLYNQENIDIKCIAIYIFSAIVYQTDMAINEELIQAITNDAEAIIETHYNIYTTFCIKFLERLHRKYSEYSIQISPRLKDISISVFDQIDMQIPDHVFLADNILSLMALIDYYSPFDDELVTWFLNKLPLHRDLRCLSNVSRFLTRRYCSNSLFDKTILEVFIIPFDSLCIWCENDIILELLKLASSIINSTGNIGLRQLIQDEQKAEAIIRTFSKISLLQRMTESSVE